MWILSHSNFSVETVGRISQMAFASDLSCFVRVPAKTSDHISRVLDGGAVGVIAPDVRSADEARAVVNAAKYPPIGRRGIAAALPHFGFLPQPAREAFAAMNAATMVIVQCESSTAVDNADAIAAVDGVDVILTGTNDLLADLGRPGEFDHQCVRDAHAQVIAACRKWGKHAGVGGLASRPALVAEFVGLGARFVPMGTDTACLLDAARQRAEWVRQLAV
jgi:4-hydroxy-2-oxoheptanedioate aldolase